MLFCQNSVFRVLIADDHELTRFSLKVALQNQQNIELVGLASNGLEAIEMVKQHRPNAIVLDLQMPVMDGLTASSHIKNIDPHIQIIAYSSVEDPQVEVMAQTARIDAFCKKDASTQDLISLIDKLCQQAISH